MDEREYLQEVAKTFKFWVQDSSDEILKENLYFLKLGTSVLKKILSPLTQREIDISHKQK